MTTPIRVLDSLDELRLQRPYGEVWNAFVRGRGLFRWESGSVAEEQYSRSVVRPSSEDDTGRWVLWHASEDLLPIWFGARGDGIVDDRPALQAMLDFATSNAINVYIPTGAYRLTTYGSVGFLDLTQAGEFTIRGDGAGSVLFIASNNTTAPIVGVKDGARGSLTVDGLAFQAPGGVNSAYGGPYAVNIDPLAVNVSMDALTIQNCTVTRLAGVSNFRVPVARYVAANNSIVISGNATSSDPYRQVFSFGLTGFRATSMSLTDNAVTYYDSGTSLPAEHFLYTYGPIESLTISGNSVTRLRSGTIQIYLYDQVDPSLSLGSVTIEDNEILTEPDLGGIFLITAQNGNGHHAGGTLRVQRNVVAANVGGSFFFSNVEWESVEIRGNRANGYRPVPGYQVVQFDRPAGEIAVTDSLIIEGNDFSGFGEPGLFSSAVHLASAVHEAEIVGNDFTTASNADASCKSVYTDYTAIISVQRNVGNRGTTLNGGVVTDANNQWN